MSELTINPAERERKRLLNLQHQRTYRKRHEKVYREYATAAMRKHREKKKAERNGKLGV